MNILEFYQKVLEATGCVIDNDGLVSVTMGDIIKPCTIDGLRMSLPTKQLLDNPDWESLVAFHPMSESIIRGESPVLKKLKLLMNARITFVVSEIAMRLMEIAVDKDYHKKLSPTASEFLKTVPNVNEKSHKLLSKVFMAVTLEGEKRISSIYLKRGGILKGNNYPRVGVVSFPITESIDKEEKGIFGVQLAKADKQAFGDLFYYILPKANEVDTYSYGSNSSAAPYFQALCGAYINVIKRLNDVLRVFKKHIDNYDELVTDISWEEPLDNLGFNFSDKIPPLPMNDGESVGNNRAVTSAPISNRPMAHLVNQIADTDHVTHVNQNNQPVINQPVVQQQLPQMILPNNSPAPTSETEDGKIPWDDVVARNPGMFGGYPNQMNNNGMMIQPLRAGEFAGYDRGAPVMNTNWGMPNNNFQNNMQLNNNAMYGSRI
jgi:hypothetical protein